MHLIGQLLLAQAQALTVVSMRVAVLGSQLAQELTLELQLEQKPPVVLALALAWELVLALAWELVLVQVLEQVRQPKPAAVPESPQSQEPAVEPRQVRELRVSRQQEQQQHRLQAAAQELLPCRPVLPMKAPC